MLRKLEKIELDELKEAASGSSNKNIEAFKEKYDSVLRKAQDLLFERAKQIKSLELKVEAQNMQVMEALKKLLPSRFPRKFSFQKSSKVLSSF